MKSLTTKTLIMNRIVLLFIISLLSVASFGQYDVTVYNKEQGLMSDNVQGVWQDKEGYIWIADEVGFNRVNGDEIINYWPEEGKAGYNNFTKSIQQKANYFSYFDFRLKQLLQFNTVTKSYEYFEKEALNNSTPFLTMQYQIYNDDIVLKKSKSHLWVKQKNTWFDFNDSVMVYSNGTDTIFSSSFLVRLLMMCKSVLKASSSILPTK